MGGEYRAVVFALLCMDLLSDVPSCFTDHCLHGFTCFPPIISSSLQFSRSARSTVLQRSTKMCPEASSEDPGLVDRFGPVDRISLTRPTTFVRSTELSVLCLVSGNSVYRFISVCRFCSIRSFVPLAWFCFHYASWHQASIFYIYLMASSIHLHGIALSTH